MDFRKPQKLATVDKVSCTGHEGEHAEGRKQGNCSCTDREDIHRREERSNCEENSFAATAALVAMLVLAPAALAQNMAPGDDDPHMPEPNAVAVGSHEELQQIAGQPVPSPHPGDHPGEVPTAPTQGLPSTGGPSVILPAAALLLVGSGILAYAALRRRSSRDSLL